MAGVRQDAVAREQIKLSALRILQLPSPVCVCSLTGSSFLLSPQFPCGDPRMIPAICLSPGTEGLTRETLRPDDTRSSEEHRKKRQSWPGVGWGVQVADWAAKNPIGGGGEMAAPPRRTPNPVGTRPRLRHTSYESKSKCLSPEIVLSNCSPSHPGQVHSGGMGAETGHCLVFSTQSDVPTPHPGPKPPFLPAALQPPKSPQDRPTCPPGCITCPPAHFLGTQDGSDAHTWRHG